MTNTNANRLLFRTFLLLLFFFIFNSERLFAQNNPIGSILDKELRALQITEKYDSLVSYTIRPMVKAGNLSYKDVYQLVDTDYAKSFHGPINFAKKIGRLHLLPITIAQQYNTNHPYGWNDGAMIAAKGYQTLISAGIYAAMGPLEIQLQPEFVYAANPVYKTNSAYGSNPSGSFQKIFPGHSSIRLSAGPISAGLSTENLWWGPGVNSSLLMSNNAPGFLHAFIGTRRPLKTPIGHFEWQLIGGKLLADNNLAYEQLNLQQAGLTNDWRYINGMVLTYHPKWVPGLFLGFTRAIQTYSEDLEKQSSGFMEKYIPVLFLAFQKKNVINDEAKRRDQLASFFIRWLLAKANAEFYLEYGYNDYGVSIRDYAMSPTHSAAYIAGFKKIYPLPTTSARIEIGFEAVQMSQSPDYLVRNAGNWYEHNTVKQGYTQYNQIIGAGAGLGCNVQSLTTIWVKGFKQLGVLLERVERDPLNHANKWVDYGIGILPQWKYKSMIISGKVQFINSSNYAWEKDVNRINLHSRLSIQYLF